jgi:hypothetical protein
MQILWTDEVDSGSVAESTVELPDTVSTDETDSGNVAESAVEISVIV